MISRVEIGVRGGSGGDGAVSFRREKFVPFGGPDGGDGGAGGDVIIKADSGFTSLNIFRREKAYRAAGGRGGRGQKKHGRKGVDLVLLVPVGTVVSNKMQLGDDAAIADLVQDEQWVVVAKGGKGGLGNTHFASSTNQAPQIAQKGEAGEERDIVLELRMIADVGIIGYPNVGKSSLLAVASAARPKIAGYPFTTLEPVLGVVEVDQRSFVLAEIPGLVVGAHLGRGLGHDFLRHVLRTKILIHLLDGSSVSPADDMVRVNNELSLFDSALGQRRQLVVINKIDLSGVQARIAELRDAFGSIGVTVHFVSAATGEGVSRLMAEVWQVLARVTAEEAVTVKATRRVFRPKPRRGGVNVHREGDTLIVESPELERVVAGTNSTDLEARRQLLSYLTRPGVSRALRKAGVQPGDRVRCGNLEWEW
ncbi:MAG: GTPase ObgE [Dehalococcoidales bacterium]